MEGQLTIFDVPAASSFESVFAIFNEHCKHKGWLRGTDEEHPTATWMCGYANRQLAKCWDDWIPCTCDNCPLRLKED